MILFVVQKIHIATTYNVGLEFSVSGTILQFTIGIEQDS